MELRGEHIGVLSREVSVCRGEARGLGEFDVCNMFRPATGGA